jgi:hypothetical protein
MGGACGTYGEEERCIEGVGGGNLMERPEGRRQRRWKRDIKRAVQEIRWGVDWIDLPVDRDRVGFL